MENKRILHNMIRHIKDAADDPFTPLIDLYLLKRLERDAPRLETVIDLRPRYRPGKRLSPSSIGGCERAAVFQFAGIRGAKKINPDTELIFENGDWFHHKWQALFQDMELVLGSDVIEVLGIEEAMRIEDLFIAGHLDIRIKVKLDGKVREVVVDVKSINDRGFKEITANAAPNPKHEEQVTTYAIGKGVKYACLLYENKDTNQVAFYVFKVRKKVWDQVETWCRSVLDQLEAKKLPPKHPDCQKGNFNYERCPHRALCFGDLDRAQLRQMVYKDFPGAKKLWKEGLRAEEEAAKAMPPF